MGTDKGARFHRERKCQEQMRIRAVTHSLNNISDAFHPDLFADRYSSTVRPAQPHEYLYGIALFTGIREGEVLGLTWDCLDLNAGTLTVKQQPHRKTAQGRSNLLLQTQEQQNPRFDAGSLRGEAVPASKAGAERKAAQSWKALDGERPCVFR